MGTGSSCSIFAAVEPRNRRRGCARRLEPTIDDLAGLPVEVRRRHPRCCRRGPTTTSASMLGRAAPRAPARAPCRRARHPASRIDAGVDARRQIDRHERQQSQLGAASPSASATASSSSASAPGRVPTAAVMRVTPVEASIRAGSLGREHDGHGRGVQQFGCDGSRGGGARGGRRWRAPTTMCAAPNSSRPRRPVPRRTSRAKRTCVPSATLAGMSRRPPSRAMPSACSADVARRSPRRAA